MIEVICSTKLLEDKLKPFNSIGFVPTMGNLHDGHLSLILKSLQENDTTVVSIYVNPTQFAAGEDFETYPRTLEQDIQKIKPLGKSHSIFIFAPESEKEIYPNGKDLINAHGPIDTLEGFLRPGHFDGVATVVKRLFGIVRPQKAYFGKKDYQQLKVIEALVKNENLPIQIIGMPIKRDSDGLALSSRNQYLSFSQREQALMLPKALHKLKKLILAKKSMNDVERLKKELIALGNFNYLEICNQDDLSPAKSLDNNLVILGNLQMGKTKLLDNLEVESK